MNVGVSEGTPEEIELTACREKSGTYLSGEYIQKLDAKLNSLEGTINAFMTKCNVSNTRFPGSKITKTVKPISSSGQPTSESATEPPDGSKHIDAALSIYPSYWNVLPVPKISTTWFPIWTI